jgi:hypothetical protein
MLDVLDDDRWFGQWPVELRLHDIVTGLSYWPVVTVRDLWDLEHGALSIYSDKVLVSFRWHDRRRWHPLKVGWWTPDHVLARLAGVSMTHRGVDWAAAGELSARDVLRRYPRSRLGMYLGRPSYGGTDCSGLVFKIVWVLVKDCGATPTEAACVLMSSGAWKARVEKLGLKHARRDVERICRKANQ